MNFELTEEQRLLKDMVRELAHDEFEAKVKELEAKHEFPHAFIKKLGELGLMGMSVPPEYEGIKTDNLSIFLVIEELSQVMPSLAVILSVHCSLFCYAISRYGTQTAKEKYLPRAAKGELLGAFSLSEPNAGSDIMGLQTKAAREGDHYILNGTKAWVTSGADAGAAIIFSRSAKDPKNRLSAFIVDSDTPGYNVTKIEEKMGLNASRTAQIELENCRIPAENLLGDELKGASIALSCLDGSRIGIAAQAVGIAQRALNEALKYAKQRKTFGRPIADHQGVQFKLADIATQLQAARLMMYNAALKCDLGEPFTKEAAMAKLFASEAADRIVHEALQIHGGYGYSREFLIEQLYRDARVLSIYEGTSEVHRIVIARELLK